MARLNSAKSRIRCSIWSLVRIPQTCFCSSGGLAPVSFPLFHCVRLSAGRTETVLSGMVGSLVTEEDDLVFHPSPGAEFLAAFGQQRTTADFGQRKLDR